MRKYVGVHNVMGVRVDNWEEILSSELRKKRQFVRGESDCVYFALSLVKAITNIDITVSIKEEYGEYKTKLGYKKLIMDHWEKYGKSRMVEPSIYGVINYLCSKESFPEISPNLSQRGDLVMTILRNEYALGIKVGQGACFIAYDGTCVERPTSELIHAWAIR